MKTDKMVVKKFKNVFISEVEPKAGDTMICIHVSNFNYGKTCVVTEAQIKYDIPLDRKNWKVVVPETKEPMQIFIEVKTDYTDPDTGNITIDCYTDDDDNSDTARVVAEVTIDGEVIRGTNPTITEADFQDPLVIEAIEEVKEEQKAIKQAVIDLVLERIKEDVRVGDMTAIDELLMFCPAKNLKGYLPED